MRRGRQQANLSAVSRGERPGAICLAARMALIAAMPLSPVPSRQTGRDAGPVLAPDHDPIGLPGRLFTNPGV
jgi:hypothetical protein